MTAVDPLKSTNVRIQNPPLMLRASLGLLSRMLPPLAVRVAQRLFVTPRRHARPARERAVLASADQRTLRAGDHRLAVYTWGDSKAAPIFLVHGWEGRATQLGDLVEPLCQRGMRVIAFDAPAHGASSGQVSSMPDFLDAIWALRRAYGEPFAVVAHSMGAAAAAFALVEGLGAERAVFFAPPASLANLPDQFAQRIGITSRVCQDLKSRLAERFVMRWEALDVALVGDALHVPLLVVHDQDDQEVTFEHGQRIAAHWPQAQLYTTQGLGHRRILRDAEVIEKVADFIGQGIHPPVDSKARIVAG